MLDDDAIRDLLGKKSRVTASLARYVGAEDGQALVDMGDQRFPVPFKSGGFVPQINEPVWVDSIDGRLFMTGPASAKPGTGVVATIADPLVTVTTDFGDFTMPYLGELPTSGDTVGISWSSEPWCGKLSTSVEPPEPPPPPAGGGRPVRSAEFRVIDTGSVKKGGSHWWAARPWSSPSNYGAWFYGTQIKDTIPADAEFVSLEIYGSWAGRRWDKPRWGTHNLFTKSGAPTVTGSEVWEPGRDSGWRTPPWAEAWFHELKAGGSRAGIALNAAGTGQEEARSKTEDGMSGALRIRWR